MDDDMVRWTRISGELAYPRHEHGVEHEAAAEFRNLLCRLALQEAEIHALKALASRIVEFDARSIGHRGH